MKPLARNQWGTPQFPTSAVVTVARDLPSNSHNANGFNEELGEYWKHGTYFGRLPEDHDSRVRAALMADAAQGDPSVAFMVLGWEETYVIMPERMLAEYIEPGRYCVKCDLDKTRCGCRDYNDEVLEEHYLDRDGGPA